MYFFIPAGCGAGLTYHVKDKEGEKIFYGVEGKYENVHCDEIIYFMYHVYVVLKSRKLTNSAKQNTVILSRIIFRTNSDPPIAIRSVGPVRYDTKQIDFNEDSHLCYNWEL